jgi:hypothetical protein
MAPLGLLSTVDSAHRYANVLVGLILGASCLFTSYAISERAALGRELQENAPVGAEPEDDPAHSEWVRGEVLRARLARRLRPVLVIAGCGLIVVSLVAALWIALRLHV